MNYAWCVTSVELLVPLTTCFVLLQLCQKGFVKVFGKEAPDEEVQREIDSQRSPEPVDEIRVSSIRNVPLYYPNKRKSETKHMLQNKRPERELCGVISTRGVACKQVAVV